MSQDKILELFKKQVATVIINEGKVDEDEYDPKKVITVSNISVTMAYFLQLPRFLLLCLFVLKVSET